MRIVTRPVKSVGILLGLSLCLPALLGQQARTRGDALSNYSMVVPERPSLPPPHIEFGTPQADVLALPPVDRVAATTGTRGQNGTRRLLDPQAMQSARWFSLPDGRSVWSLRLESPSAVGLRIHFDQFSVGNGQVWVLDGALGKTQFFGPYTGTGPLQTGELWTEIVFSDTIEIEYVPGDGTRSGSPPFHLVSLSHLWDLRSLTGSAAVPAATTPNYSCFLDATCYGTYQIAATPSLEIGIELPNGTQVSCSATLVRTVANSGIPYLLTAGHCIYAASSATSLVAIWHYQSSVCGGAAPTSYPQQTGSTLLSYSDNPGLLDYSFVQLSGLPAGSNPAFSGWNSNAVSTSEQVVSMSHPWGLPTKYAFGARYASGDDQDAYEIIFTTGYIDEGSSGSGLFETDTPGVLPLMGVLSESILPAGSPAEGTLTICDILPGASEETAYTKFTSIYPYISSYLNDSVTPPPTTPTITAFPNPIPAAGGTTTLTWNAPGHSGVVIRINSPTGTAMTGTLPTSGSIPTGTWVTDGMTFYLVDASTGANLANVVVSVGASPGGTPSFTAYPNPIPAAGGTTTLTWNAPGHSGVVIRINSATGTAMTGTLPTSGSIPTGTWVTDGMTFYLVDASTGANLNNVVVHVGANPSPTPSFTASPNPITDGSQKTTLSWNAPGHTSLVIRIGSATGTAMTGTVGTSGTADTGTWVTDGMTFYLVDVSTGATANTLVVRVGNATPSFSANPNPIPAAGQKTTLTWNAPGHSAVVIRINSATGPAMTGTLGTSGSADTGTWVTNGMQFFLVDASSGATINNVVVHVAGTVSSNFNPGAPYDAQLYCVNGASSTGCNGAGPERIIAASFTPSATFTLSSISLPLSYISGSNNLAIYLLADNQGYPGLGITGYQVESWIIANVTSDLNSLTIVNDVSGVRLQAGKTYWIAVTPEFPDTFILWAKNNEGYGGGMALSGHQWIGLGGTDSMPAFAVTGFQ